MKQFRHHQRRIVSALAGPFFEFTGAVQGAGHGGHTECLQQGQLQGTVDVLGKGPPRQLLTDGQGCDVQGGLHVGQERRAAHRS
jgi:hypothetical protein